MPDHKSYIGRYFSVQHAAAVSLNELTAKDWGFLYNEDYLTWLSWLRSAQPDAFAPSHVARSASETAKLIGHLFHRFMSARPNPWQLQNALATAAGIRDLARDLKELGSGVVPLIVNVYQARVKETPLWNEELRQWTSELLQALNWSEAREAAETLAN